MMQTVPTILGDSRPIERRWEDGSVECPWCHHPIIYPAQTCGNPWCDAHPAWTAEALQKRRDDAERERKRKEQEAATRREVNEWAKQQAQAREQKRRDEVEEAERRGCCLRCLHAQPWRTKFIKHRGKCPRER